mmetsp:Transcript_29734/g.69143  ORF Transcript_29734/g.69143 Transcript_29734/m.69143 type:complete len:256 (+) Transcript_29734:143-910(+)
MHSSGSLELCVPHLLGPSSLQDPMTNHMLPSFPLPGPHSARPRWRSHPPRSTQSSMPPAPRSSRDCQQSLAASPASLVFPCQRAMRRRETRASCCLATAPRRCRLCTCPPAGPSKAGCRRRAGRRAPCTPLPLQSPAPLRGASTAPGSGQGGHPEPAEQQRPVASPSARSWRGPPFGTGRARSNGTSLRSTRLLGTRTRSSGGSSASEQCPLVFQCVCCSPPPRRPLTRGSVSTGTLRVWWPRRCPRAHALSPSG